MPNRMLYDAFPTRGGADAAVTALRSRGCAGATSKRLARPQDGGRLKYGVYAPSRCLAMGLAKARGRLGAPRVRKMRDEFIIQTNYGYGQGWEDTTAEDTRPAARGQLKTYRDNQPEYPHRLIKRRVRL